MSVSWRSVTRILRRLIREICLKATDKWWPNMRNAIFKWAPFIGRGNASIHHRFLLFLIWRKFLERIHLPSLQRRWMISKWKDTFFQPLLTGKGNITSWIHPHQTWFILVETIKSPRWDLGPENSRLTFAAGIVAVFFHFGWSGTSVHLQLVGVVLVAFNGAVAWTAAGSLSARHGAGRPVRPAAPQAATRLRVARPFRQRRTVAVRRSTLAVPATLLSSSSAQAAALAPFRPIRPSTCWPDDKIFIQKMRNVSTRFKYAKPLEMRGKITWRQTKKSVTFRVKNKTPRASCYREMKASDEKSKKGPATYRLASDITASCYSRRGQWRQLTLLLTFFFFNWLDHFTQLNWVAFLLFFDSRLSFHLVSMVRLSFEFQQSLRNRAKFSLFLVNLFE